MRNGKKRTIKVEFEIGGGKYKGMEAKPPSEKWPDSLAKDITWETKTLKYTETLVFTKDGSYSFAAAENLSESKGKV